MEMEQAQIPPVIQERATNAFPISVATSLAFEGLFGILEDVDYTKAEKFPYKRFDTLAINYRTLIRNIMGSVNSQHVDAFTPEIVLTLLGEEIRLIEEIVATYTRNKLDIIYYSAGYQLDKMKRYFPHAYLKEPTTAKQLKEAALEDNVLGLIRHLSRSANSPVHFSNLSDGVPKFQKLPRGNVIYLTHLPLDMLLTPRGRKSLLESHTGTIKREVELNTKLKGKPDNVPFDIMTVQMLGDTGNVFNTKSRKFKEELLGLAKKCNWTSATTESKIKADCKGRSFNKEFNDLVKDMYHRQVKN